VTCEARQVRGQADSRRRRLRGRSTERRLAEGGLPGRLACESPLHRE